MKFESADGVTFDDNELPESLRDLVPLLQKWGVVCDLARSKLKDSASTQELEEFVARFEPWIEETVQFVSTGEKNSELSCYLMTLLEFYDEACGELGLRSETADFPDDSEDR
jgi:hypothetical protein